VAAAENAIRRDEGTLDDEDRPTRGESMAGGIIERAASAPNEEAPLATTPAPNTGRARPRLSTKQRFELAGASVANAIDLNADARVLLASGRLQRAAFLLYACVEELLKGHLCLRGDPDDWTEFWRTFRDHDRKLAQLDEVDPGQPANVDELIAVLTRWRERCLYVEVSHPGNPLTPRGLVDPGGLDAEGLTPFTQWIDQQIPRFIERLKDLEPTMRGLRAKGDSPR
jgi:AbiV family abortive infection protein